jgi:hypothetical protein
VTGRRWRLAALAVLGAFMGAATPALGQDDARSAATNIGTADDGPVWVANRGCVWVWDAKSQTMVCHPLAPAPDPSSGQSTTPAKGGHNARPPSEWSNEDVRQLTKSLMDAGQFSRFRVESRALAGP